MTKKCSFGFLSSCSTSAEENSLFQIRACLKSTRNHLRNLNCEFDRDIPEGLLILYRSGLYSVDSILFVKNAVMSLAHTGGDRRGLVKLHLTPITVQLK